MIGAPVRVWGRKQAEPQLPLATVSCGSGSSTTPFEPAGPHCSRLPKNSARGQSQRTPQSRVHALGACQAQPHAICRSGTLSPSSPSLVGTALHSMMTIAAVLRKAILAAGFHAGEWADGRRDRLVLLGESAPSALSNSSPLAWSLALSGHLELPGNRKADPVARRTATPQSARTPAIVAIFCRRDLGRPPQSRLLMKAQSGFSTAVFRSRGFSIPRGCGAMTQPHHSRRLPERIPENLTSTCLSGWNCKIVSGFRFISGSPPAPNSARRRRRGPPRSPRNPHLRAPGDMPPTAGRNARRVGVPSPSPPGRRP
jgi:hypothetical protein